MLSIDDQTYKALTCESYVWRGLRFVFAINSGSAEVSQGKIEVVILAYELIARDCLTQDSFVRSDESLILA